MAPRIAFNPISWYTLQGGWKQELAPPLEEQLRVISAAGYEGLPSRVPEGMTAASFTARLAEHGMAPAPSYFSASFADVAKRRATVEAAKRDAAEQAALGLRHIYLAEEFGALPARVTHPAQGVERDDARLAAIAEGIAAAAEAMVAEGVLPCLHGHVATLIETPDEAEFVLARVPEKLLGIGLDTGHLAWAGGDPAEFVRRHAGRVHTLHIKDIHKAVAEKAAREGADYWTASSQHIWTEPGRGDVDIAGTLKALGKFDGWLVVEVDVIDQPTVEDTMRVSIEWLRAKVKELGLA